MKKISVCDEKGKELLVYNSDIIPVPGDIYAAVAFEDIKGRTIPHRQLHPFPDCDIITVYTKITYPHLHN